MKSDKGNKSRHVTDIERMNNKRILKKISQLYI